MDWSYTASSCSHPHMHAIHKHTQHTHGGVERETFVNSMGRKYAFFRVAKLDVGSGQRGGRSPLLRGEIRAKALSYDASHYLVSLGMRSFQKHISKSFKHFIKKNQKKHKHYTKLWSPAPKVAFFKRNGRSVAFLGHDKCAKKQVIPIRISIPTAHSFSVSTL